MSCSRWSRSGFQLPAVQPSLRAPVLVRAYLDERQDLAYGIVVPEAWVGVRVTDHSTVFGFLGLHQCRKLMGGKALLLHRALVQCPQEAKNNLQESRECNRLLDACTYCAVLLQPGSLPHG